jgi:hypothetical protein
LGRKRTGKRKHVYCIFAGLIISITLGCVSLPNDIPHDTPYDRFSADLQNAADLYAHGDFENSLKINQGIFSQCDRKPPGDQALFNVSLIYASQNYPKKDYKKSIAIFQRIVREYPQSPLAAQSKTWIEVLSVIERSKEADIEIEQTKKKLSR